MPAGMQPPEGAALVRTTGVCAWCDSRFADELAWSCLDGPDDTNPALIEARHFGSHVDDEALTQDGFRFADRWIGELDTPASSGSTRGDGHDDRR